MPFDQSIIIAMLKRIHLFRGVEDPQFEQAAKLIELVEYPADQAIFNEGEPADYFYFIIDGKVSTTRYSSFTGQTQPFNELIGDDYFGEEVLENDWPRQISAKAATDVKLARLSVRNFIALLEVIPPLARRLQLILDSYRLALKLRFNWTTPDETVYFIARKHVFFLLPMIFPPILGFILSVGLFGGWYLTNQMTTPLLLLFALVPAMLIWLLWNYIDWSNDYYIITSQRVVYQERVIFLYDSRQESPLEAVQSTTISSSQWGRWVGYGNVAIRTYIGTILFRNISFPDQIQSLVQEHQLRAQFRETRTELKQVKGTLDSRIRQGPIPPALPKPFKPPAPPDPLRIFVSTMFHLRYKVGDTVIYRTHWFILVQRILLPSLILLGMAGLFIFNLVRGFPVLSLQATCGIIFLFGLIVFGWWLYQYIDWHNDVYMITGDQVVDVNKKPLGTEQRQAAPIKNILSIEYERVGILGLLLNYGTVYIRVGDQKLTFDNVLNPSEVQRELFHSLAKTNYEERQRQSKAEKDRLADWFAVYNDWAKDNQQQPRPNQPPPRPGF